MQSKFMSTDAFLRLEKEWQHVRKAQRHLELEVERPRPDSPAELEPSETAHSHART
ncbi:hypothetical protein J2Z31_000730 [Sinorhizobium kostiense]|uniref:Uncharacterized protein n=1 Tax=Sinorhizobium kostiense TaxID=76747 RepID=A0ABS4QW47_9HYPH|nr:hypothetical protein [Sinorhizobium kostiense]MBP2234240.1 hypothetical protein [Sinorhizobium kostiense]